MSDGRRGDIWVQTVVPRGGEQQNAPVHDPPSPPARIAEQTIAFGFGMAPPMDNRMYGLKGPVEQGTAVSASDNSRIEQAPRRNRQVPLAQTYGDQVGSD